MHQFRTEHPKALLQFLNLVIDFFFEVRRFLDPVAEVDVHESLDRGKKIP
jgi:hypothetical protein